MIQGLEAKPHKSPLGNYAYASPPLMGIQGFSPGKFFKSDIAVGEFRHISDERMITFNRITLRAKSF